VASNTFVLNLLVFFEIIPRNEPMSFYTSNGIQWRHESLHFYNIFVTFDVIYFNNETVYLHLRKCE